MDEFDFETLEQELTHESCRKLCMLTALLEVGVFATEVSIARATESAEALLGEVSVANAKDVV